MNDRRIRLLAISGATLALVVASSAVVSAHGPRDDDRGFGMGRGRIGMDMPRGGAVPGMGAEFRGGLRGALDDVERRELTLQTEDGTTVSRVENGVVDGATDTSLDFTLASGETVSVTIDDDTDVIAFSEETVQRGRWARQRLLPSEIEPSDVVAGDEVVVWSDSEDGGDFVATRVVVQPTVDETDDTAGDSEVDADASETDATVGEDAAAAVTDA
jgi:hypothetical protein